LTQENCRLFPRMEGAIHKNLWEGAAHTETSTQTTLSSSSFIIKKIFVRESRELPSIATNRALTERSHRFIGGSCLSLTVTNLLLTALAAGQTGTDTPLCLGDHGLVHVFLLQSLILGTLLVTLQLFVGHAHEAVGLDEARKHLTTELWVALVFEILIEGAYALAVFGTSLGLVCIVSSKLDGAGNG
jgi:hypothetical protein